MALRKFRTKVNQLREFYKRWERYLIPAALLSGFLTDLFTFQALGLGRMLWVFLGYVVFVGINISAVNHFRENYPVTKIGSYWELLAPLFIQFSFGNLFSGFLIFYSKSGSFFASWPFLVVFILLFVANEFMRRVNISLLVHIGIYFFVAFSYFNLVFPYLLKSLSVWVFLGSGFLSLLLVGLFIYFLTFYSRRVEMLEKNLWLTIVIIFLTMNVLYFVNLIPPIPLSLKDVGVYHYVERTNGNYEVLAEKCENWDNCLFTKNRVTITKKTEPIYVFSAVHAPLDMKLDVAHEWWRYDTQKGKWVQNSRLSYGIRGGREGGYRLYTYNHVTPGHWRVNIETERGQVIGRKSFQVVRSNNPPELIEKTK